MMIHCSTAQSGPSASRVARLPLGGIARRLLRRPDGRPAGRQCALCERLPAVSVSAFIGILRFIAQKDEKYSENVGETARKIYNCNFYRSRLVIGFVV